MTLPSQTHRPVTHPLVVDRVRDSPLSECTGAPPGVSAVKLAVHTLVSRRRSDADMEALTQQMSDEATFREERARKTDAMMVTFLSKANGAPPPVLDAWGIPHPPEETSPVAQSTDAQPGQASQVTELSQTATSPGNRDVPSMKSRDKDASSGARRSCRSTAGGIRRGRKDDSTRCAFSAHGVSHDCLDCNTGFHCHPRDLQEDSQTQSSFPEGVSDSYSYPSSRLVSRAVCSSGVSSTYSGAVTGGSPTD